MVMSINKVHHVRPHWCLPSFSSYKPLRWVSTFALCIIIVFFNSVHQFIIPVADSFNNEVAALPMAVDWLSCLRESIFTFLLHIDKLSLALLSIGLDPLISPCEHLVSCEFIRNFPCHVIVLPCFDWVWGIFAVGYFIRVWVLANFSQSVFWHGY